VGKLQGKVDFITGGTTGIGFAAGKLFVEVGPTSSSRAVTRRSLTRR
jgi:NAD(P)-dependent dehydrogenase (short-subunit alcohol dehydrogenase family)